MEDKIEVGEYVRTTDGIIGKLVRIEKNVINTSMTWYVLNGTYNPFFVAKSCIVKHSKRKIKLIYIDDYVNGLIVIGKYFDENDKLCLILDTTDTMRRRCYEENIKSIVTKEQFESVKYEVRE